MNDEKAKNNIISEEPVKNELSEKKQIDHKLLKNKNKMIEYNNNNELKIYLYPDNKPRYEFETESLEKLISNDTLAHSLDINKKLAYINSKVPVLNGFYNAHESHLPIRIKPDDIWLLIVQAFSNHVNNNAEKLRKKFVNFEGQKDLIVNYPISSIKDVDKNILEDFSVQINKQMIEYLGEEVLNILTPNFTTTDKEKIIIFKISIMGAFKKYFKYIMCICGCGIPYLIIEGTAEDYEKIFSKAKELKKYDFEWYIDRILPIIQKFIDAKKGYVDINYFKNIVQEHKITEYKSGSSGRGGYSYKVPAIKGWILNFFAYYDNINKENENPKIFNGKQIKIKNFNKLANQMLDVPFKIIDANQKEYLMKYRVGFIGCDKNELNEVFPVTGWIVSPRTEEDNKTVINDGSSEEYDGGDESFEISKRSDRSREEEHEESEEDEENEDRFFD